MSVRCLVTRGPQCEAGSRNSSFQGARSYRRVSNAIFLTLPAKNRRAFRQRRLVSASLRHSAAHQADPERTKGTLSEGLVPYRRLAWSKRFALCPCFARHGARTCRNVPERAARLKKSLRKSA